MTIRIDQPRAFDLVGNPILVGGIGTGFEATLNYRVHEGHDEVTGFFTALLTVMWVTQRPSWSAVREAA